MDRKKLWDFAAPEHMRRKWQRNSVKEGFLPQLFTVMQMGHIPKKEEKRLKN